MSKRRLTRQAASGTHLNMRPDRPVMGEANRKCGSCSVCCTTMAVGSLGKATYEKCSHVRPGTWACTVYDGRPKECSSFECGWLQGFGNAKARPDKSNVVVTFEKTRLGDTILLMEARKGATKTGRVLNDAMILAEKNEMTVIIAGPDYRVFAYVPDKMKAEFDMAMAEYEAQKKPMTADAILDPGKQ